MAFGDIGGVITELIITCKTPGEGEVAIAKGGAVSLTGAYTVDHAAAAEAPVFGQALADVADNGAAVPVKVRGVCIFPYTGAAPAVDGASGVVASDTPGAVKAPLSGSGRGVNLAVDETAGLVHVLL